MNNTSSMDVLANTVRTLDLIRKECGEMETQGLSLLLFVMASDPDPLTVNELMSRVGASHGSIIRYLRILGSNDDHPRGDICHGLIQCSIDPQDRRRKLVTLSTKGRVMKLSITNNLTA